MMFEVVGVLLTDVAVSVLKQAAKEAGGLPQSPAAGKPGGPPLVVDTNFKS